MRFQGADRHFGGGAKRAYRQPVVRNRDGGSLMSPWLEI